MVDITNNDIHKIIDDAMKKRDRYVHILITDSSTSVSVSPYDDDGMKWIELSSNGGHYFCRRFRCSKCGAVENNPSVYCPNCGEQRTGIIEWEDCTIEKTKETADDNT